MGKVLDDKTNGQGPKMTKMNRKYNSRLDGFGFNSCAVELGNLQGSPCEIYHNSLSSGVFFAKLQSRLRGFGSIFPPGHDAFKTL